jgi:hypothetical protein
MIWMQMVVALLELQYYPDIYLDSYIYLRIVSILAKILTRHLNVNLERYCLRQLLEASSCY